MNVLTLPGRGDLGVDPGYFDDDDAPSVESVADGYLMDPQKVDDLLGDVAYIDPNFRPALLAVMEGDAGPLAALIRKHALLEAARELMPRAPVIRFPAHGIKPAAPAEPAPDFLRQLPPGWTLEDLERADRRDYLIGFGCGIGLAAVVAGSLLGVIW